MPCKHKIFPPVWLLLTLSAFFSHASSAGEHKSTNCHVEKSTSGWQFLNSGCDIGNGLWGRKPKGGNSSFWLQCNYGMTLPNNELAVKVNQLFADNSYLIPDNGHFRCLIGPFQSHSQAESAKAQLAEQHLGKTFIRQTSARVSVTHRADGTKAIAKSSKKHIAAKTNHQKEVLVANRVVLNAVIYSFTFNKLKYHQPKTINSTQEMPPAFTLENNQYWSKVNFLPAENWCKRYGLRLPTVTELKDLQTYGQHLLLRHKWPIKSSYWSKTINLYSGEIKTLNLRNGQDDEYRPFAQLYTTCVTEAS